MKLTRAAARKILAATFPNYNGRKITLNLCESALVCNTIWDGGSICKYVAVRWDGVSIPVVADSTLTGYEGVRVSIPTGYAIVKHEIWCGQDMGITIYANLMSASELASAIDRSLHA